MFVNVFTIVNSRECFALSFSKKCNSDDGVGDIQNEAPAEIPNLRRGTILYSPHTVKTIAFFEKEQENF